jgi:isoleucyl-tRNA synthetase
MEDPYVTYKPKYMETVWWILKQIYKDLMYTIQPYSQKPELISHEVNQPGSYQMVDTTVVAQFKALRLLYQCFRVL